MQRHVSHDDTGLTARARQGAAGVRGDNGGGPFEGMDYIKYCQYTALYYACKYRSKEVAFDLLNRHIEVEYSTCSPPPFSPTLSTFYYLYYFLFILIYLLL
jgi:S-adenosylmethionine synthetase